MGMIMVDNYKKTEEQHYDIKAQYRKNPVVRYSDYVVKESLEFYYRQIREKLPESQEVQILDYGCGGGEKHFQFAKSNNHILGIDISSKSVEIANQQAKEQKLNAEYLVMDCEKMTFPDHKFDMVLDFGTFSSLNMEMAIKELCRVMKKDGIMICFETYGHNPFMKIKRGISVLTGRRTKWAANHIMKKRSWDMIGNQFESNRIHYFHFLVLFLPIFLKIVPKSLGDKILSVVEKIDKAILKIRIFQFLAFKTVVVASCPVEKKNY
jgi:ubiquinone/menaquinone biosynthesis C-methylase UbiE